MAGAQERRGSWQPVIPETLVTVTHASGTFCRRLALGSGPMATRSAEDAPPHTLTVRPRETENPPGAAGPSVHRGKAGRCWLLALHPILCSRRRAQDILRPPGTGFPGRTFTKAPLEGPALCLDVSTQPLHPWPPCCGASAERACASLGAHCRPTVPLPNSARPRKRPVAFSQLGHQDPFQKAGGPPHGWGRERSPEPCTREHRADRRTPSSRHAPGAQV